MMNDDATAALARIADALELGAIASVRDSYWATYDRIRQSGSHDKDVHAMAELYGRIARADKRIDQLTGHKETT